MSAEILIIGLGRIGASIGLALSEAGLEKTTAGYDPDRKRADRARLMKAVDELESNLAAGVRTADLIILTTEAPEVRTHIEKLAPNLKSDAVVLDTSSLKSEVLAWANELFREDRHYVGAVPVGSPRSLPFKHYAVDETPRADLFEGGLVALVTQPGAPPRAIDTALGFCSILRAAPLFMDPAELDSMAAAVDGLPVLLSFALMKMAAEEPNWRDMQKLADRSFALGTQSIADRTPGVVGGELWQNRERLLQRADRLLASLEHLRALLAGGDEAALTEMLEETAKAREAWVKARESANWSEETTPELKVSPQGFFQDLLGLGRLRRGTERKSGDRS